MILVNTDLNVYKYQLIYKFSKAQIYTSISQFEYAKKHKLGPQYFCLLELIHNFINPKNHLILKIGY